MILNVCFFNNVWTQGTLVTLKRDFLRKLWLQCVAVNVSAEHVSIYMYICVCVYRLVEATRVCLTCRNN